MYSPAKEVTIWCGSSHHSAFLLLIGGYEIPYVLICSPPFLLGSAVWDSQEIVLPGYLFIHSSPKDFWVGLSMLLMALDSTCITSRLLSSTSEHQHLVDAVINVITSSNQGEKASSLRLIEREEAKSSVFWPALQTTVTLLDRLVSQFWQLTGKSPTEVFKAIVCSPLFLHEVQCCVVEKDVEMEDISSFELDSLSCSQVVYNWGAQRSKVKSSSLWSSSNYSLVLFSWFLPFMESLFSYGDVVEPVFVGVMNVLCNMVLVGNQQTQLGDLDSLLDTVPAYSTLVLTPSLSEFTEHALLYLAQVVNLFFTKERYSFLLAEKSKWLPMLTAVALLKGQIKSISTKRSPVSLLFRSLSQDVPQLPFYLVWSLKALHCIISSSSSHSMLHANRTVPLVAFLSPKLHHSANFGINTPSSESVQAAVTAALSECDSQQDIMGPFLYLQKPIQVSRPVSTEVKKEPEGESVIDTRKEICTDISAAARRGRESDVSNKGNYYCT